MKIDSDKILALAETVAHVGHWAWNFDTQEVFWSPGCFKIFGRNPDSWIPTGENFRDDMPDEDREKLEEANLRGFESGVPFQLEYRYFRGGSRDDVRWIRVSCDFLVDASGTNHMVGIAQDITESKRAEEVLRDSRDRIRLITDNLPVAIAYFDAGQRYRFVNRTLAEWYARPAEDILGHNIGVVLGQETYEVVAPHVEAALKGKEQHYERVIDFPDGKTRTAEVIFVPHIDNSGAVLGGIALVQDITERKRVEAALLESETRFRTLVEYAPEAITMLDVDTGLYLDANPMAETLHGLPRDELIGKLGPADLSPEIQPNGRPSSEAAAAYLSRALAGEFPRFEWMHLTPDGQETPCEISLARLPDPHRKLVRASIIDITERQRAEQEIQKLNEDLERRVEDRTAELRAAQDTLLRNERLSTLGQLTATVSHELRNPLGVIRTSVFTLRGKVTDGEPRVERMLDRIERNVLRCDRIIDELLDFTRISQLEPVPTPLDAWLREILNEQTLPSGVALRFAFDRPDMAVSLDPDRFRRAIINVFDNACQAMIGEGLEDADSEAHTLTVRTEEHDGRIEVIFEDTGPGIPPDIYEKIFEPLYSTKGFGVGLGLPVVKHIMEQHSGGIEIESEAGRGTRVCLWLPTSPSAD